MSRGPKVHRRPKIPENPYLTSLNKSGHRRVGIGAHRGGIPGFPENSLEGLPTLGRIPGAVMLEADGQRLKKLVGERSPWNSPVVVTHDSDLARITGGRVRGKVADYDVDALLREVPQMPLLEDVLRRWNGPISLDVKDVKNVPPIVRILLAADRANAGTILSSFGQEPFKELRKHAPQFETSASAVEAAAYVIEVLARGSVMDKPLQMFTAKVLGPPDRPLPFRLMLIPMLDEFNLMNMFEKAIPIPLQPAVRKLLHGVDSHVHSKEDPWALYRAINRGAHADGVAVQYWVVNEEEDVRGLAVGGEPYDPEAVPDGIQTDDAAKVSEILGGLGLLVDSDQMKADIMRAPAYTAGRELPSLGALFL